MNDKIPLAYQFRFPTLKQDHPTGDWNTTIGCRNIVVDASRNMAALLANPEYNTSEASVDIDTMASEAVDAALAVYAEIEERSDPRQ